MQTKQLPENYDNLAPDGSEIRGLLRLAGGNMVHCTLPAGKISIAVAHKTVEEMWFFLSGRGEVWRKNGEDEQVTEVAAGVSLSIPLGTGFQFRNVGEAPLCILIATMPPWPGPQEAFPVPGKWEI